MAFLTAAELPDFYPHNMDENAVKKYLARANAYCFGVIGGIPPTVDDNLKAIVANGFEILAEGEVTQTDQDTGIITDAAPTIGFNRNSRSDNAPLNALDKMLAPYKRDYEASNSALTDTGFTWLGKA